MFLVGAREELLGTICLSNNAGPVQIVSIGVDAQTLRSIAMSMTGAMKDGLIARLESRGAFVLQTRERERHASIRTFRALADMRMNVLEAKPLHGTENNLELTTGSRALFIC